MRYNLKATLKSIIRRDVKVDVHQLSPVEGWELSATATAETLMIHFEWGVPEELKPEELSPTMVVVWDADHKWTKDSVLYLQCGCNDEDTDGIVVYDLKDLTIGQIAWVEARNGLVIVQRLDDDLFYHTYVPNVTPTRLFWRGKERWHNGSYHYLVNRVHRTFGGGYDIYSPCVPEVKPN
ncbi:hypothetical protein [Shimazuella kribbensis]|uniref:hypothetical protein n=1 Tax=Shimazuella kribbensis TaxID=139808 RepID=UPI00040BB0A7|nr:hypothetical protein [Shimazuella kribbensis]